MSPVSCHHRAYMKKAQIECANVLSFHRLTGSDCRIRVVNWKQNHNALNDDESLHESILFLSSVTFLTNQEAEVDVFEGIFPETFFEAGRHYLKDVASLRPYPSRITRNIHHRATHKDYKAMREVECLLHNHIGRQCLLTLVPGDTTIA